MVARVSVAPSVLSEESRLALLVVDPFHVHAYWTLQQADRIQAFERLSDGEEDASWVLRFFDLTAEGLAPEQREHFDIPVLPQARNWYVDLWADGKSYVAELGLVLGSEFASVCRSNTIHLPRAWPAPHRDAPAAARPEVTRTIQEPALPADPPSHQPALVTASVAVEYFTWLGDQREREKESELAAVTEVPEVTEPSTESAGDGAVESPASASVSSEAAGQGPEGFGSMRRPHLIADRSTPLR